MLSNTNKTNEELLKTIGFPKSSIKGDSLSQIIGNLISSGKRQNKAEALLELCSRYGEERLFRGAQFQSSTDIFNHFRVRLRNLKQEHFITVLLNNKHEYLADKVISIGTLNRSLVHPREVFSAAIEYHAASIICVHNHPTGDPTPSKADHEITAKLKHTGEIIGIPLLDHIIIGFDRYISLADDGLL